MYRSFQIHFFFSYPVNVPVEFNFFLILSNSLSTLFASDSFVAHSRMSLMNITPNQNYNVIKGLQIFINDIRECQTKESEAKRVDKELDKIRKN